MFLQQVYTSHLRNATRTQYYLQYLYLQSLQVYYSKKSDQNVQSPFLIPRESCKYLLSFTALLPQLRYITFANLGKTATFFFKQVRVHMMALDPINDLLFPFL